MNPFAPLVSALRRRLLGISPEEIRYTIEDVRAELRTTRAELRAELAEVRKRLDAVAGGEDRPKGPEIPVAEA